MAKQIALAAPEQRSISIEIESQTELIMHQWSDKARKQMLDKQMGKAKEKKQPKDPVSDYESSIYHTPAGEIAFPASGFKAAIVGSARLGGGIPMTTLKQALRVNGDWVKIKGKPRMREDMVRLETGVADIRYRAGFPTWSAVLDITYIYPILTDEQVVQFVNLAGFGGIGEWRPSAPHSASGTFGCFRVKSEKKGAK